MVGIVCRCGITQHPPLQRHQGESRKEQTSWALGPGLLSEKEEPLLPAGHGSASFRLPASRRVEPWTLLAKLQAWPPDTHHKPSSSQDQGLPGNQPGSPPSVNQNRQCFALRGLVSP